MNLTSSELLCNLDKIHSTELGIQRIKRNLALDINDVIAWCREKTAQADQVIREGKNWYVHNENVVITVNAHRMLERSYDLIKPKSRKV